MLKIFRTGWHVLYVRSCQEKKVNQLLQENQLESFLPMVETIKKWSDRKKIVLKPLFPSYVFVKINSAKDIHNSLGIDGGCCYITFGNQYALVQDHEIEMIKLALAMNNDVKIASSDELLIVGEIKTIQKGPLEGRECEIININNQNRIIVRIKSIQQNILVTIPVDYFCPLSQAV